MENCVFCRIAQGQAPANILKRWSDTIAIVPVNPVVDGHVLIIPIDHVADALENPAITATTMKRAAEFAQGQCNLITSVGRDATQSIFHLHIHIVPRKFGDGLLLPWSNQQNHSAA